MTALGSVLSNTALSEQVVLTLNDFRKGSTSPTDSTLGTTPTVPTLLFSATGELLTLATMMPFNFDRGVDIQLILVWSLAAAETNGDTLDVTLDYTVGIVGVTGSGPDKASTQVTGQVTVTTAEGLAVGDIYTMSINLPRADATNPYTDPDAGAFSMEMHLTNVTGVSSAHLIGACIAYERLH